VTVTDWGFGLAYFGFQRTVYDGVSLIFGGMAESRDGLKFRKKYPMPVLDRDQRELYLRSSSFYIRPAGSCPTVKGVRALVWYTASLSGWEKLKSRGSLSRESYPKYAIKFLGRPDHVCIPLQDDEFGIGRPWVLFEDGLFKMWYSVRSPSCAYRIGYAESLDAINWKRKDDEVQFAGEPGEWETEMQCFGTVIDVGEERYMFYNGNKHGKDGFGVARLMK